MESDRDETTPTRKRFRIGKLGDAERELTEWISQVISKNVAVTGKLLNESEEMEPSEPEEMEPIAVGPSAMTCRKPQPSF
uniref:Uncharacterized protein n=1 Tax=Acrobeloides nanus TaxID=290746 RepID=A0A914CGM4_9BILA